MFKYLWRATFSHRVITQHPQDRYSKYNPAAEHNPSSFRDFQEYFDNHKDELKKFELISKEMVFVLDLSDKSKPIIYCDRYGRYGSKTHTILHKEKRSLHDVRVIYFRNMSCDMKNGRFGTPRVDAYVLGYQGRDDNGNNRQKQITVI